MAGESFTHLPVAEFLTLTTCGNCPAQEAHLEDIFANDGYPWYYVALVCDENDEAMGRAGDYESPVITTPSTYYDGGDEQVDNGNRADHTDAINTVGERSDTEVFLNLTMEPVPDDPNRALFSFTAEWEEDGTMANPDLQVTTRVYVMERISTRYQNSHDEWIHHAFLSFAYEENVDLDPHTPFSESVEWVGADHSDDHGDMSDVVYDNLLAMAVVFNNEDLEDEFALEAVGAIPPDLSLPTPEDQETVTGDMDLSALAVANHTTMDRVRYRIDDGSWSDLTPDSGDEYNGVWDSSEADNGEHRLEVRAVDATGAVSLTNVTVNVDNDENAPELTWLAPDAGDVQSGTVTIEVEAVDPQGIDSIELKVDDRTYKAMDHDSGDSYTYDWDTTTVTDDIHTITVRAKDNSGNEETLGMELEVDNGAATKPAIDLLSPTTDDEPLHGIVQVRVRATDPGAVVEQVEYTYQGTQEYYELTDSDDDQWYVNWNTVKADSGDDIALQIRATNDNGHSSTENYAFAIDNEPPRLTVTAPTMEANQAWAILTFTIEATDGQGPVTPRYRVDQGSWTDLSFTGSHTHTFDWDTTTVDDGYHELRFQVIDGAGHTQQWSGTYEVINEELAQFELSDLEPPTADQEAELTISVHQGVNAVNLIITAPIQKIIPAVPGTIPGEYTATFPAFEEHGGSIVVYHLLLRTDLGDVETDSQSFRIQPVAQAGSGSDDDDDNTVIYVAVAAAIVVALGGVGFVMRRDEEPDGDEWDTTAPQPIAPTPSQPSQPILAPQAASPMALPVTCPHCANQMTPPPGSRPMLIGCPFCGGQMQVN